MKKSSKIFAGVFVATLVLGASSTMFACSDDNSIYVNSHDEFVTAIEEAQSGEKIVLKSDIDIEEALKINKEIVIELNGKTLTGTELPNDNIFEVGEGGKLTINGEGTIDSATQANDYSLAVWAVDGGEVIINGGTFKNVGGKDFEDNGTTPNNNELLYASWGGKITINGGTFIGNYENETYGTRFTLNVKDEKINTLETESGTIVVKGGKFYKYNPAASLSENPQANFVADGYESNIDGDYYVVSVIND